MRKQLVAVFLVSFLGSFSVNAALVASCSPTILDRLNATIKMCQQSLTSSQDFRRGTDIRDYTVNVNKFFGFDNWEYIGEAGGKTSGQSGQIMLPSLNGTAKELLLIFKGPNAYGIIGLWLKPDQLAGIFNRYTWRTPFVKNGKKPIFQDVSHVSLYAINSKYEPLPPVVPPEIPEVSGPTTVLSSILLLALGIQRFRRRKQC